MMCPHCNCADRIADPFQLSLGFRVVLYDHMPFYNDRELYKNILRDYSNRQERLATRDAALINGRVHDAFLNNIPSLLKDTALVCQEVAVYAYNRCQYKHNISDILIGRNSRFCFFSCWNADRRREVYVCCREHT